MRTMTAQDVYESTVSQLPASERLRLATLILEGLEQIAPALDFSDVWSEEDLRDLTSFSEQHFQNSLGGP